MLRDIWTLTKSLPTELALAMERWIMRHHWPDKLDGRAWCMARTHRQFVEWPCEDYLRADRRIDDLLDTLGRRT